MIKLRRILGTDIKDAWIHPDHIVSVCATPNGTFVVPTGLLKNEYPWIVEERAETVVERWLEAKGMGNGKANHSEPEPEPRYSIGDFVEVRLPSGKVQVALIRHCLSHGNVRGIMIKRGLSPVITILAADIIGKAPADFTISEAQAKTLGILPRTK